MAQFSLLCKVWLPGLAVSVFLWVVRQWSSKLPVPLKTLCRTAAIKFQNPSTVDSSSHHSFRPCTSSLSAQTPLGSGCLAFCGTIAQKPFNRIVCNIYNGWCFRSVFIQRKSFSFHYHAQCHAEVEGKEGKYSVFVSGLSMHLLGRAGSCFCLIKAWLMNRGAEEDREIGGEKRKRSSPEPEPSQTPAHAWIRVRSLSAFV